MPTITVPYTYEHAVTMVNGTTVTQWATFMVKDASGIYFFKGFALTSISLHASAPTVTTTETHDFLAGDKVYFFRARSIAPSTVNIPEDGSFDMSTNAYTVASPSGTTFTIAENVTTAGAGGFVGRLLSGHLALDQVASVRVGEFLDRRPRDQAFY